MTFLCSSSSGGLSAGEPHRQLPGAAVGPSPSAPPVGGHLPGPHLAELRPGAMVWRSRQRPREALHPTVGPRAWGDASHVEKVCLVLPGLRAKGGQGATGVQGAVSCRLTLADRCWCNQQLLRVCTGHTHTTAAGLNLWSVHKCVSRLTKTSVYFPPLIPQASTVANKPRFCYRFTKCDVHASPCDIRTLRSGPGLQTASEKLKLELIF